MIALAVSVPIACWRKGFAREYLETEPVPPPSTLYGFLLSLVGETDREAHIGARVTGGIFGDPPVSRVLRTVWRIKEGKTPQGVGSNARPDWQELVTGAQVVVLLSSIDESGPGLEGRVADALAHPERVDRFGGLSMGESTHLIDSIRAMSPQDWAAEPSLFLQDTAGDRSMTVWVDHVGNQGTRYAIGRLSAHAAPPREQDVPRIDPEATLA